jgi:hypothetical protein
MDEHVHRAITAGLRLRDVDVLTAQEDGRRRIADDVLLDRATELQRGLFLYQRIHINVSCQESHAVYENGDKHGVVPSQSPFFCCVRAGGAMQ